MKIALFLNCNKIKKLNCNKAEQIIEAAADNDNLEVSADKTMIRRKNLDDLPEFQPKKKIKSDDQKP